MVIVSWIALPWGVGGRLSARVLPTSPICAGAACACWSGGMVDVSETGFCSPAAAAVHPGDGPAADSAMSRSDRFSASAGSSAASALAHG
jgi:hypothetical protein